jgi:hypothetical protein
MLKEAAYLHALIKTNLECTGTGFYTSTVTCKNGAEVALVTLPGVGHLPFPLLIPLAAPGEGTTVPSAQQLHTNITVSYDHSTITTT